MTAGRTATSITAATVKQAQDQHEEQHHHNEFTRHFKRTIAIVRRDAEVPFDVIKHDISQIAGCSAGPADTNLSEA
jgi:hypothetical protein